MYTERFSLAFVSGLLIAAAERRRPGLGRWSDQVRAGLRDAFTQELVEIRRHFFELFGDQAYWERLERALFDDCLPRYLAVAQKQAALEESDYGLWRGGDLLARGAYALGGLAVGVFLVKAPFIPIPETWDFLILALLLGAPFLPDLQVRRAQKRFQKALARIVEDMREAQEARRLYEPLQAPARSDLPDAGLEEAGAPARAADRSQTR